ncbi:MAG: MarR family winged helix-turn-helix transcriptional regulator [Candidatus Eiseniibacteriota bacterium]
MSRARANNVDRLPRPARAPAKGETAADEDGRLSLRVWLHLMKSAHAVETLVAGRLRRAHNQSFSRFDVLSQLYRFEGGWIAVGELAGLLMSSGGNITALLDRMELEDLIERRASPSDRRSFQVRMTAEGRALFMAMNRDHARWVDAALGDLPDSEKEQLIDLLVRVRHAAERAEALDETESKKAGRG